MHPHRLSIRALMRTAEAGEALRRALAEALPEAGLAVVAGTISAAGLSERGGLAPHLLIVDIDLDAKGQMAALRALLDDAGETVPPVLVTSATATTEGLRNLLKLRIADYLPQPFQPAELAAALTAAATRQGEGGVKPVQRCHVLSVATGGAGSGASTLAVQMAAELARRCKPSGQRVCLTDLDLRFGTTDLYLDLKGTLDLAEIARAPQRLDAELLKAFIAHHRTGIELLAPADRLRTVDAAAPEVIGRLLEVACQHYDFLIADLPPGWCDWSAAVLAGSDVVVAVTQLSVAAVRQTRTMLDLMARHGIDDKRIALALNRFDPPFLGRGDARTAEAEAVIGRKFDHFVTNDYAAVSEALNRGVVLLESNKSSKLCRQIRAIVDHHFPPENFASGGSDSQSEVTKKRQKLFW